MEQFSQNFSLNRSNDSLLPTPPEEFRMKTLILTVSLLIASVPAAYAQTPMAHDHGTIHTADAMSQAPQAIPATGTVNAVDATKSTLNLTHEPIQTLGWPTMTMDFAVAPEVDLATIKAGDKVNVTLARGDDGIYMITSITPDK
jgi:Cu/Ag efflux protein CusF